MFTWVDRSRNLIYTGILEINSFESYVATFILLGYRHVKLESSIGAALGPASVFVLVKISDMSRSTWLEKKDSKGKSSSNNKPGVRQMLGKWFNC